MPKTEMSQLNIRLDPADQQFVSNRVGALAIDCEKLAGNENGVSPTHYASLMVGLAHLALLNAGQIVAQAMLMKEGRLPTMAETQGVAMQLFPAVWQLMRDTDGIEAVRIDAGPAGH